MEKLYKLFRIHCHDLLVLEEMEWNGMLFNTEEAIKYAQGLEAEIKLLTDRFNSVLGVSCVSISSVKHLSSVLYGGIIDEPFKVAIGYFKSGERKGQVKYGNKVVQHKFERIVDPLEKTETANSTKRDSEDIKEWSVAEDVLLQLKAKGKAKEIITIILEYRKLEKLRGTYLQGWTDLIEEMDWEHNMIHGSLNQCVVVTGRLSATKPNVQTADKKTKMFMESRYA